MSPAIGDGPSSLADPKKARKNPDDESTHSNSFNSRHLFSINGLLNEEKPKIVSPLNTPTATPSLNHGEDSLTQKTKTFVKKRKPKEDSIFQNKTSDASDSKAHLVKKKRKKSEEEKKIEEAAKEKNILFEPSQIDLVENGKIGSWEKFVSNQ